MKFNIVSVLNKNYNSKQMWIYEKIQIQVDSNMVKILQIIDLVKWNGHEREKEFKNSDFDFNTIRNKINSC